MRRPDPRDLGLERGLLRGIAVFRVIACGWAIVGVAVSTGDLARPFVAWILVSLIATATLVLGRLDLQVPHLALAPAVVAAELALGALVLVGDGLVFEATRQQSLPWAWPAAGVMTAGVGYGKRAGLAAAVFVAVARKELVADGPVLCRHPGRDRRYCLSLDSARGGHYRRGCSGGSARRVVALRP